MELTEIKELGFLFTSDKQKEKRLFCIYKCFCGNEFKAQKRNIINGNTKSCGCLQKKRTSLARKTHGDSNSRLYKIYIHIKTRCHNQNEIQFKDWGGRGISICDEWDNSYETFKDWALKNGYKENLSIDRKNNDGNYEPSNCRWVKKEIQARNTRKIYRHNTSGYRGVSFVKKRNKWKSSICVNKKTYHLGYYDIAIEAAKAYDNYVIKNNLEHTINNILN